MSAYSWLVECATLPERHVRVDVVVEILERLAVPLVVEDATLERGRAGTLQLGAMADRAFLRVFPAALAHLRRGEEAGAVGECGWREQHHGSADGYRVASY